jgi:hypothetical protein
VSRADGLPARATELGLSRLPDQRRLWRMTRVVRLHPWWLIAIGFMALAALVPWIVSRLGAPEPGSLEAAFSRVRVGMSQEEALDTLLVADVQIDDVYLRGETTDGKPITGGIGGFSDLPPPAAITHAEVEMRDWDGQSFTVFLGPGGVVSGKRFTPYRLPNTWRELLARLYLRFTS